MSKAERKELEALRRLVDVQAKTIQALEAQLSQPAVTFVHQNPSPIMRPEIIWQNTSSPLPTPQR